LLTTPGIACGLAVNAPPPVAGPTDVLAESPSVPFISNR
jgi:hypothetical protein